MFCYFEMEEAGSQKLVLVLEIQELKTAKTHPKSNQEIRMRYKQYP